MLTSPNQSTPRWDTRTRRDPIPRPAFRRLRGYAFDPSLSLRMETAVVNEVVFRVPWEPAARWNGAVAAHADERLPRGPIGEYVEVVDYDPASGCFYEPVDLDKPEVLAQDGLAPTEGNPQFHQQMVYAVAMTTIRNFERALGRIALWAPRAFHEGEASPPDNGFCQRLRIYPHALREANAYYSPAKKALLFGYFPASSHGEGSGLLPGGTVFACLSHDIIAHETTHALLDGMNHRFIEPTHPDALAFHEAFADIVALFQHFSFPEVLRHQVGQTRGNLSSENLLGELAQQFGQAIGNYGALRSYIGSRDETGKWVPKEPQPEDYHTTTEPHARGAILVAAVFEAFLTVYRTRVADLLRIASNGTGVLQDGALHPDLVNRLASEAAKSAQHVLNMCIRGLDYCPPVDICFGDYLRAIVTADSDLFPDDDLRYRVAMIEAFRRRGIYPRRVRTLSVDSLRWPLVREQEQHSDGLSEDVQAIAAKLNDLLGRMADYSAARGTTDYSTARQVLFSKIQGTQKELHELIANDIESKASFEKVTGVALTMRPDLAGITCHEDGSPKFEVHSLRRAARVGPDGHVLNQAIISITQKRLLPLDEDETGDDARKFAFRGGCTLIFDLDTLKLRYSIRKEIDSAERLEKERRYRREGLAGTLRATYFAAGAVAEEPFALLHRGPSEENA